jgi:hypothetical protein
MSTMVQFFVVVIVILAGAWQKTEAKFVVGTIVDVKDHASTQESSSKHQYDVSIRVEDKVYTVLFTPEPASTVVQYRRGVEVLVAVTEKTMQFKDLMGRTREVPILSVTEMPRVSWPFDQNPRLRSQVETGRRPLVIILPAT